MSKNDQHFSFHKTYSPSPPYFTPAIDDIFTPNQWLYMKVHAYNKYPHFQGTH